MTEPSESDQRGVGPFGSAPTPDDSRLAGDNSDHPSSNDARDELAELRQDNERLARAVERLARELGGILDAKAAADRAAPPRTRARQLVDEADPTSTLADGDPYPLNASEDRRAYHRWLEARRRPTRLGGAGDPVLERPRTRAPRVSEPFLSVIVPVYRTPLWALRRAVGSVFSQRFSDWELVVCDDASCDPELSRYLEALRRTDRRVRVVTLGENRGIAGATNAAVAASTGRYLAFLDHDDELADDALRTVADAIGSAPGCDFLYTDEDKIDLSGERFDPLFKPDWSPDLLLSFAYTCHLTVVARTLFDAVGALRTQYDGSQDYDLALRATERARTIVHVPDICYHWRILPGSAATDSTTSVAKPWAYEAGRRAIEDALRRRNEPAEVTEDPTYPGRYHVRRHVVGRPRVSIIIPFRDEPAMLADCIGSMRRDPGYDNFEFVLVDNQSELPETAALLDRLSREPDVVVARYPKPFNWSAVNNFGVEHASGEVLLFSNNDIEASSARWLEALVGHALRPEVGAVGAKLLYPDRTIQHVGVVLGLGGIAGHLLRGLRADRPGYNSASIATRDCSVVTGACLMCRRDVFEAVGRFNEELPVAFNDVDFCLKLRERDLLVVFTPLAELVHYESKSRGHTDDLVEHAIIVDRWADELRRGDPYLNPNLSHWRYWCPLSTAQEDYQWKTYLERSISTPAGSSSS